MDVLDGEEYNVNTQMKTNNAIANHIARRNVTKVMERSLAVRIWNDLKREGWTPNGVCLEKEGEKFVFTKSSGKIKVNFYSQQEVTA